MAIVVLLGIAYTQTMKGHITVDIIVSRFSPTQLVIDTLTYVLALFIFALMAWQSAQQH